MVVASNRKFRRLFHTLSYNREKLQSNFLLSYYHSPFLQDTNQNKTRKTHSFLPKQMKSTDPNHKFLRILLKQDTALLSHVCVCVS